MALLGSRGLLNLTSSRPQARLRCQHQQLLLQPGSPRQHSRRSICQAAASDQKNASEPMYLSDLILFESDAETASPTSSSSSSSDFDAAAAGPGDAPGQGGDPTVRAQEIISRATEVLAAARAALGTSNASSSAVASEGASNPNRGSSSSRGRAAGGSATLEQPLPPTSSSSASSWQAAAEPQGYSASGSRQQQSAGSPASGSSGSSSSSSSGSSDVYGGGGSPSSSSDGSSSEPLTRRWSPLSEDQDLTRHVLQNALDQMQRSGAPIAAPKEDEPPAPASSAGVQAPGSSSSGRGSGGGGGPAGGSSSAVGSRSSRDIRKGRGVGGPGSALLDDGHGPAPSWAQSLLGSDDFGGAGYSFPSGGGSGGPSPAASVMEPQMQRTLQQAADRPSAWGWATEEAEPLRLPPAALGLLSQSELDAQRARTAVLPPLQSVVELTTAFRPPERSGGVAVAPAPAPEATTATATAEAAVLAEPVGRALPDGSGRLADGTWWEKKSGIERGKNGYWKRWQTLKGGNAEGTLDWEETWWEASDWTGLKEMGARKEGRNTDGAAWRETWSERLMYASNALDTVVERNAHKWAADPSGDEWEEKWGEHYHCSGKVAKYADKWGKAGPNVWHERWGEDYDAGGDACVKWTDKWAERLLPGGAREQWGDKWHEAFANGRGEKNGEVWSVGAGGDRYQRWWGEQHLGDQRVRRHGHSTTGENWDDTITMDTYYNPVPHFGFKHALSHSPQLRGVPLQPKEINAKDPFGPGLDDL